MKTLIADDDPTSRLLMQKILEPYGECNTVSNGEEAVSAFEQALQTSAPYNLICMDIMMPKVDGHTALKEIRAIEVTKGILARHCAKIIMTTALRDMRNVAIAQRELCDGYLAKPIDRAKLIELLQSFKLIE